MKVFDQTYATSPAPDEISFRMATCEQKLVVVGWSLNSGAPLSVLAAMKRLQVTPTRANAPILYTGPGLMNLNGLNPQSQYWGKAAGGPNAFSSGVVAVVAVGQSNENTQVQITFDWDAAGGNPGTCRMQVYAMSDLNADSTFGGNFYAQVGTAGLQNDQSGFIQLADVDYIALPSTNKTLTSGLLTYTNGHTLKFDAVSELFYTDEFYEENAGSIDWIIMDNKQQANNFAGGRYATLQISFADPTVSIPYVSLKTFNAYMRALLRGEPLPAPDGPATR